MTTTETKLSVSVEELARLLLRKPRANRRDMSEEVIDKARRMLAAEALYDALLWTHRIAAGEDEVKRPSFDDLLDIRKIASDALALADGKEA